MQSHRHTLPPLPTNLSPPTRPDISSFSFSHIGRTPALLQRFGPKTSAAVTITDEIATPPSNIATTQPNNLNSINNALSHDENVSAIEGPDPDTIIEPIESTNRNEIVGQRSQAAALEPSFTFLEPDLWADAARVQEEWASVKCPRVSLDSNTGFHVQTPKSSPSSIATPHNGTPLDKPQSQSKLKNTNGSKAQHISNGISTQSDHHNLESTDIPVQTTQTSKPPITLQADHPDCENLHGDITHTVPYVKSPDIHGFESSLPVQPFPNSKLMHHSEALSNHGDDNPAAPQPSFTTAPGSTANTHLSPAFSKKQGLPQENTAAPIVTAPRGSIIAPISKQDNCGEDVLVPAQIADATLQTPAHDVSRPSHNVSNAREPAPASTKPSLNLRHREKVSETTMVDSYKGDHTQRPASRTHAFSDAKMTVSSHNTQVKRLAQGLTSEPRDGALSKQSTSQIPSSRAPGRYVAPHGFVPEEIRHLRSSGTLSPGRSSLASRLEKQEHIPRPYPELQDRRDRSPPRASLHHNENRMPLVTGHFRPRSRSPSPSNHYRRPYNARSRSPRSPYGRRIQNRTPSPPRRRRSPQRPSRFEEQVSPSRPLNPERLRSDHYSPPRRHGTLSLPPRPELSSNAPDHTAYRRLNLTSNGGKPSQNPISNIAEASNAIEKMQNLTVSAPKERKVETMPASTERQIDTKTVASKRNRDDPEYSQLDTPSGKRRKVEGRINDTTPGESTLASRLDPQYGHSQKFSFTTKRSGSPQGEELLQRLSDSSGRVSTERPPDEVLKASRRISSHINHEPNGLYPAVQNNRTGAPSLADRFNLSASPGLVWPGASNSNSLASLADRVQGAGVVESSNTSTRTPIQTESSGSLTDRLQNTQCHDVTADSEYREMKHGSSSLRERLK